MYRRIDNKCLIFMPPYTLCSLLFWCPYLLVERDVFHIAGHIQGLLYFHLSWILALHNISGICMVYVLLDKGDFTVLSCLKYIFYIKNVGITCQYILDTVGICEINHAKFCFQKYKYSLFL